MSRQLRLRGAALSDLRRARGWYEHEALVRRALMTRFHYAVYFVVEEEVIMIYAILHQARHESGWKPRVPREKL